MYTDMDCIIKPIADLDVVSCQIPVHVIFGAIDDYLYASSLLIFAVAG